MILENLEELKSFVLKETDIRNVSVIFSVDNQGTRATIDHGTEEAQDGKPLACVLPVTVTISDTLENYRKVNKNAEILRAEIVNQKSHKWNAKNIERVTDASNYTLIVNIDMPYIV